MIIKPNTYYPINTIGTLKNTEVKVTKSGINNCHNCILLYENCIDYQCTELGRRDRNYITFKKV